MSSWNFCVFFLKKKKKKLKDNALYFIWRVIYWTAYVSIWAVYPLLSSYSASPEFKASKRWWRAVKENLIYYGIYAVVGVALIVYIAVTQGMTFERMMGLAILISNTFGLLLVIVLLSIGLVRIPRNLWRLSRRPVMLKHYMWHIRFFFLFVVRFRSPCFNRLFQRCFQ